MVDSIAAGLASDFLVAQGWACIHLRPDANGQTQTETQTQTQTQTVVTVGGISARDEPGIRIWLSRKHVDKVMAALFSRCRQAQRRERGDGLVIRADIAAVASMIRNIASNFSITLVGDDFIDGQMALVTNRIEAAIARMKRDGSMKMLNREYATARASGTPLPGFRRWLVARLRPAFAGLH
jgi:hypothetical protein